MMEMSTTTLNKNQRKFIITLTIIFILTKQSFSAGISMSNARSIDLDQIVNTAGNYQVQLMALPNPIIQGTEIRIIFPTGFTRDTGGVCTIVGSWSTPEPTLDCSSFSGGILSIKNGFALAPSTQSSLAFQMTNVINPKVAGQIPNGFRVSLFNGATQYDTSVEGNKFKIYPKLFSTTSLMFVQPTSDSPVIVNTLGRIKWDFTIDNSLPISTGWKIMLTLPQEWSTYPGNTRPNTLISDTGSLAECQSPSSPSMICSVVYDSINLRYQIILSSLTTSTISGSFTVYIGTVLSTPTREPLGILSITTLSAGGEEVQKTDNLKIGASLSGQFTNVNLIYSQEVNTIGSLLVKFTINSPLDDFYSFDMTFSNEISIQSNSDVDVNCQDGYGSFFQSGFFSGNSLTIVGKSCSSESWLNFVCPENSIRRVITNTNCDISFSRVLATQSARLISKISLALSKNNFQSDYSQILNSPGIKAGTITQASVTLENQQINVEDNYQFVITLKNEVDTTGKLVITLPVEAQCKSTTFTTCSILGSGVTNSPTCTCDKSAANNIITISNLFIQSIPIISELIIGPIKNPPSTKATSAILIQSFYDSGNVLTDTTQTMADTSTLVIKAIPGVSTDNLAIEAIDDTVGKETEYQFSVLVLNPIPAQSSFEITLATGIAKGSTSSPPVCQYSLDIGITFPNTMSCSYTAPSPGVRAVIRTGGIGLTHSYNKGDMLYISVGPTFLKNPLMTVKGFYNFQIKTFLPSGDQIDLYSGAFVPLTMTQTVPPAKFEFIEMVNKTNGALSTYRFSILFTNSHPSNSYLFIDLPTELTFEGSNVCTSSSSGASWSILSNGATSCFQQNGGKRMRMIVTFNNGGVSQDSTPYILEISGVRNYRSYKPIKGVQMTSADPENPDFLYNLYSDPNLPIISSTLPGLLDIFQGAVVGDYAVFGNDPLKDQSSWNFQFTTALTYPNQVKIILTFPAQFDMLTPSITSSNGMVFDPASVGWLSPEFSFTTTSVTAKSISFTVNNVMNPKMTFTSNRIKISTYEVDNLVPTSLYLMDAVDAESWTNVVFTHTCTLNCRTCDLNNKAKCLSCYSDSQTLASSNIKLNLDLGTCEGKCKVGFFESPAGSNNCLPCDSNCSECNDTSSKCTACKTSGATPTQFLDLTTNKCVASCPSGYFGDQTNKPYPCVICELTKCKQCTTNKDNCTICNYDGSPAYYMQGNVCQQQCDDGFVPQNGVCVACTNNCKTCQDTQNFCLTCISGYYFLPSSNACYSTCPPPNYQDSNNPTLCKLCEDPCAQCSSTAQSCSQCLNKSPRIYLMGSSCIQSCPAFYYQDEANLMCVRCISPCNDCDGPSNCRSCLLGYFLSGTNCVSQCPDGYFGDTNGICQKCISPCQSCLDDKRCLSCQTGSNTQIYIYQNSCLDKCPTLHVNEGLTCVPCQKGCTSCQQSASKCSGCISPFLYNDLSQSCSTKCELDFFQKEEKCVTCEAPCKRCIDLYNKCLSCTDGFYLYENQCLQTCPDGYFAQKGKNTCTKCELPCANCLSQSQCLTCDPSSRYFYQDNCLKECPSDAPIPISNQCVSCPIGCIECETEKICKKCGNKYLLLNTDCVIACPTGFEPNSDYTKCDQRSTINSVNGNFQEKRLITFPFLIGSFVFSISVVVAQFQKEETFLPGSILGFCSILEWGSWIVLLANQASQEIMPQQLGVTAFVILANYIFNIVYLVLHNQHIRTDPEFQKWVLERANGITHKVIFIVSMFTSFKIARVMYSKYFGFNFFKLQLTTIDLLIPINILTGLSALLISLPLIGSAAATSYQDVSKGQAFFFGLDAILVTTILIIFSVCDSQKDHKFFEDHAEFDNSLLSKLMIQSLAANQESPEKSLGDRRNSQLSLFNEQNKTTQQQPLERPFNEPLTLDCDADEQGNSQNNTKLDSSHSGQENIIENASPGKREFKRVAVPNNKQVLIKPIKEAPIQQENDSDNEFKQKSARYNDDGEEEPIPLQPTIRHTVYYNNPNTSNIVGVQEDGMNQGFEQTLYERPDMAFQENGTQTNIEKIKKQGKQSKQKQKNSKSRSRSRSPSLDLNQPQGSLQSPTNNTHTMPNTGLPNYPGDFNNYNRNDTRPMHMSIQSNKKPNLDNSISFNDNLNESLRPLQTKAIQLQDYNQQEDQENIMVQNTMHPFQRNTPLVLKDIDSDVPSRTIDHNKSSMKVEPNYSNLQKSGWSEKQYEENQQNQSQKDQTIFTNGEDDFNKNPKQIFDSRQSVHSLSDGAHDFNEISPSDFNVLNQRYPEDYFSTINEGQQNPAFQVFDSSLVGGNRANTINNPRMQYSPTSENQQKENSTVAMAGRSTLQNSRSPNMPRSSTPNSPEHHNKIFAEDISVNQSYQHPSRLGIIGGGNNVSPLAGGAHSGLDSTKNQSVDLNKIKNLEKIYLQRIDGGISSKDSKQRLNIGKQKKKTSDSLPLDSAHGFGNQQGKQSDFYMDDQELNF